MIVDTFESLLECPALQPVMKKIEPFVRSLNADIANGRYEIDGDAIFGMVSHYTTKPFAEGKMETHKKYVDLQMLVQGKEYIHVQSAQNLQPIGAFNEASDIGFYFTGEQGYSSVLLHPGVMALLFPHEAHMPQIQHGERALPVIKVVIKIAVECFA